MNGGVDKANTIKEVSAQLQAHSDGLVTLEEVFKTISSEVRSLATDIIPVKESLTTIVLMCQRLDVAYDNYIGSFNKLAQITTVEESYERYESLKSLMKSRNPSLSEDYYTMSFVSGLKEEIRNVVQMFKPASDTDAFYLARMQQASGHMCKTQQLFMLVASDDVASPSSEETEDEVASPPSPAVFTMEISLHALTGSTHSFVDAKLAEQLQLPVEPTGQILVTVANGDSTISRGIFNHLQWSMQDYQFQGDLRVLPLGGCDIVLGVHWLKQLGDITFNLAELKLTFLHHGHLITLQGSSTVPSCNLLTGSSFLKFLKNNTPTIIGQFFSISAAPLEPIHPDISTLLDSYADVFEPPTSLPPKRAIDHQIPLKPNAAPISQRPYRCPHLQKSVVEKLIQEMLDVGFIQDNHSPFASPVLLVKKKDGSWRFCVDYRKLNDITIKDKFPIPLIDDLLDELHGVVIFSKIDLKSRYYQILMHIDDIHKTAFRTHQGHYEFRVMPFGLTNALATFQSLMNTIFKPFLRKFVLVFFDDILIYSKSLEEHAVHLAQVLSLLRQHSFFANKNKYCFAQNKLAYLGHLITSEGVAADPDKIAAMQQWPQPTTLKQLRGFLGLTG
ncbi:uncharacterized protein K02A2.6-like [Papaver somniferum]|uniref:uncharacterized protein K02A2.6-like n=1 Tax=Papaver somniferum TaxID=3469 RepID=UPI000E6FDE19|nr:uncharacterized protein K02A2.6-like [Papaver somniferum]